MMRFASFAIFMALISGTAVAQSNEQIVLGFDAIRDRLPSDEGVNRECLVRKNDGKVICRTRDEWREIAARLSASKGQPK